MHVQSDVSFLELDAFVGGALMLCNEVINALVKKLNGEKVADPCGG